ncbi:MAG: riboflavin biosynthesis protein RibF [Clostridia bacterium]|nr:riboflavin biosynthesis protein RibF [Clostridia bacterium]
MVIIQEDRQPFEGGSVITIGNFDGVHIGHRALMAATAEKAREMGLPSLVWTFKKHPRSVFDPSFKYVISDEDKINELSATGIDYYYAEDFERVKDLSPEEFVDEVLIGRFKAAHLICGYDFSFGKGGVGTPELLRKLLGEAGVGVTVMPAVLHDGEEVSSTRLRALIAEGNVERAADFLGRLYSFKLPVTEGLRIGRFLGSPTINQPLPSDKALPSFGVYAVFCDVKGTVYGGVANIGVRPTVTGGKASPTCETHIFGFNGTLYGEKVRVYLYKKLRAELKFGNLTALSAQIAKDSFNAKKTLEGVEAPKGEAQ